MIASAVLDTAAFLSQFTALSIAPISLLSPLSAFGPVFTTLIAIFTIGEVPTVPKFAGILLTVIGAYLLNIKDIKDGLFKPFSKLINNRGAQLFLLATFLWGITPIFQKKRFLKQLQLRLFLHHLLAYF